MLTKYVYTEYFPNRKCISKFTFSYLLIPFLCPIFCYPHTFPIRLMMSKSGGEKKKVKLLNQNGHYDRKNLPFFLSFFHRPKQKVKQGKFFNYTPLWHLLFVTFFFYALVLQATNAQKRRNKETRKIFFSVYLEL